MKTLIENALIIPMTERGKTERGSILIEDGRIAAIGDVQQEADETIDASSMIALPSFVNAHTHTPMVLMRNYKDSSENLQSWLSEIFPIEDKLTDEDVLWASELAMAELIQGGCTCFADMYFYCWSTVKAASKAGMRGIIGQTFFGDAEETRKRIRETVPLIDEAIDGSDMFRVDAGVHAIYTCTADTYRIAADWVRERGAMLHTHLSETRKEVEDSIREYGMRPAEYLESIGALSVPCYLAHSVWLSEKEMDILAAHDRLSIVHNPVSNMKLASGIAPVRDFMLKGINVALGTDGASSNNTLNMMKEMNTAALLATVSEMTPAALTPYDAIAMATANGAKALGLDDRIGTIEIGKDADILLLSTDCINATPLNDPFSAIVFAMDRKNIDTVFCKGRKLLEHGQCLTVDTEEARRKTNERWQSILRR